MSEVKGLDDDDSMSLVTIVSSDGSEFKLTRRAAELSKFVKNAIAETDTNTDNIVLEHIESDVLSKLVEWMRFHESLPMKTIERPLKTPSLAPLLDEFDANYVNDLSQDLMFKILLAANYMDIDPLLHLMCAKVASMLKGKTAKQIRATFEIRDDATPEELEHIRNEYRDLLK